ncbi:MAG: DNA methyltransferase, partial [Thermoproteota archaeon]
MGELPDECVHLVVTSPPYPMVALWDDFFTQVSARNYNQMHAYLHQVWAEVERVLVSGGLACVNVGDATRTKDGVFHLYPNHSSVIQSFENLGLV